MILKVYITFKGSVNFYWGISKEIYPLMKKNFLPKENDFAWNKIYQEVTGHLEENFFERFCPELVAPMDELDLYRKGTEIITLDNLENYLEQCGVSKSSENQIWSNLNLEPFEKEFEVEISEKSKVQEEVQAFCDNLMDLRKILDWGNVVSAEDLRCETAINWEILEIVDWRTQRYTMSGR